MQCITNTFCNLAVNAVHEMPEKGGAAELEGALPGSCSPRWRLYMTFITTVSSHNGANSCGMDWPNVKPCTPPSSQQM